MQDKVFLTTPRIGTLQVEVSPFAFIWDTTLHQFPGGVVNLPDNAASYVVIDTATMQADVEADLNNTTALYLDYFIANHGQITKVVRIITQVLTTGDSGVSAGIGSPEGIVSARPGSMYTDITNPADPHTYVKGAGTGNTGWVG
jgi:hypothetical protein